jgi:hypothetical protein
MTFAVFSLASQLDTEAQPSLSFNTKPEAVAAARRQYVSLLPKGGADLATMVMDDEQETAVVFIIYKGEEIDDIDAATDLAERLSE